MQHVQQEVSVIEAWEVEAEKLTLIAIAAFQHLQNDTSNIMENDVQEAMAIMKTKSDEMFHEIQREHQQSNHDAQQWPKHSVDDIHNILLNDQTWKSGGIEVEAVIQPSTALETIKSIPLKTYKLRDDKQRDLGVDRGERRTRCHVGVIDKGDDDTIVESSAIFSYNIGAVSHLATALERISSMLTASMPYLRNQTSLKDKVSTLKYQTELNGDYAFKSPGQLASEVAALETEAALTRIHRHSQSVVASIRVNLIHSRLLAQLKSLASKSEFSERTGVLESNSVFEREIYADETGSYLDRLLIYFEALGKIEALWTAAER